MLEFSLCRARFMFKILMESRSVPPLEEKSGSGKSFQLKN